MTVVTRRGRCQLCSDPDGPLVPVRRCPDLGLLECESCGGIDHETATRDGNLSTRRTYHACPAWSDGRMLRGYGVAVCPKCQTTFTYQPDHPKPKVCPQCDLDERKPEQETDWPPCSEAHFQDLDLEEMDEEMQEHYGCSGAKWDPQKRPCVGPIYYVSGGYEYPDDGHGTCMLHRLGIEQVECECPDHKQPAARQSEPCKTLEADHA